RQLCGEQRLHRRQGVGELIHSQTIACRLQSFPLRDRERLLRWRHDKRGHEMAFDPNAATARYIDSLGPAALQKAHDYTIGKEWMLLWALLVAGVVTWLIVRSGFLDKLDGKLGERRRNLRALIVSFVFLIVSTVLSLPWTLYADYFREKSYGRTSQPLGDFLMQGTIAALISAVVGALFFTGVYWLMRRTGKRWWLWSGGLAAVVLAFFLLLSPVLI